jgi:hypothetical protein
VTTVLELQRWCPQCEKVFTATKIIERRGRESTSIESPCPEWGTAGELLLAR